jgi:hypothetical protein
MLAVNSAVLFSLLEWSLFDHCGIGGRQPWILDGAGQPVAMRDIVFQSGATLLISVSHL